MSVLDPARAVLFSQGRTTVFSCKADPRIAYCLYVPKRAAGAPPPGLVVAVHGSGRVFMEYRDGFADFAAEHGLVVLAPLFPAGILGDGNVDGYKYLVEGDIRYDLLLLALVEEVAASTGCASDRFMIFGYSGGAHFVHRFLMVHPERVLAASIGAPGQVSLLDPEMDWWAGTKDFEAVFGHPVDLAALRRVAVQMIVGADDLETWEITHAPGSRYYRAEAARAGVNRVERLRSLQRSFEAEGIAVRFDVMPGTKHASKPAMPLAQAFFARVLQAGRG